MERTPVRPDGIGEVKINLTGRRSETDTSVTYVATQEGALLHAIPSISLYDVWRFRGQEHGFKGTSEPRVVGSSPTGCDKSLI